MTSRRDFLKLSSAAALTLPHLAWAAPAPTTDITTPLGTLRGLTLPSGVRSFRAVPFAQPPIGPLRFRAATPAQPWKGTRDATTFGPASLQPGDRGVAQSEDCLTLNLWTPPATREPTKPLPVFVWVHGGGFTGGTAFAPIWDGEQFAQLGIIVVTVAYRLGALGFLDVSPLLGKSYAGSANHALGDVVTALEWVQRNIASFGGDPTRVTLGGESAGAKLTDLLLASDAPAHLFSQAISQSGGADRIWTEADAADFANAFGKRWTDHTGTPVSALLTADARTIVDVQELAQRAFPRHFPFRAELAAPLFHRLPLAAVRAGASKSRRLLIGTNHDESALFLGPHPERPVSKNDLGNMPLSDFEPIAARYADIYPELPASRQKLLAVTAEEYLIPTRRLLDAHVSAGGTAFTYRFDFNVGGEFEGETPHAFDLGYVWNHLDGKASDAKHAMAAQMHAAWASFIRGEAPNAPGLPAWPRYNTETRPTMLLDRTSHVENDPAAAEFQLWEGQLDQR